MCKQLHSNEFQWTAIRANRTHKEGYVVCPRHDEQLH
jgi:hypothetical protein